MVRAVARCVVGGGRATNSVRETALQDVGVLVDLITRDLPLLKKPALLARVVGRHPMTTMPKAHLSPTAVLELEEAVPWVGCS